MNGLVGGRLLMGGPEEPGLDPAPIKSGHIMRSNVLH